MKTVLLSSLLLILGCSSKEKEAKAGSAESDKKNSTSISADLESFDSNKVVEDTAVSTSKKNIDEISKDTLDKDISIGISLQQELNNVQSQDKIIKVFLFIEHPEAPSPPTEENMKKYATSIEKSRFDNYDILKAALSVSSPSALDALNLAQQKSESAVRFEIQVKVLKQNLNQMAPAIRGIDIDRELIDE